MIAIGATHSDSAPLLQLAEWRSQGKRVALAMVVSTWGSSPRPVGSYLAVTEDGDFSGSVSGGCIEGDVVEEAIQVIKKGISKTLEYGVTDNLAWEVGLSCGGTIKIYVEPIA